MRFLRQRQTDRQTDRERQRETETERQREAETRGDREREEKDVLFKENLLSLFKSSQSQSYLIYNQSKVKTKLIYIHILLLTIVFSHLSQPVCYHPYSVCKTVSVFLNFLCLQCRLGLAWCL